MTDTISPEVKMAGGKAGRAHAAEAPRPNGALGSYAVQANDVLTQTAQEFYKSQRAIMDGMTAAWQPMNTASGQAPDFSAFVGQMQEGMECFISNTRKMSDAARDCGWRLAAIYADAAREGTAQLRARMSSGQ